MKRPLLSLLPLVITACGGEVTTPPADQTPSPNACERAQVAVPEGQKRTLPLGCTITTLGETIELAVEAGQYYRLHAAAPEGVGVVVIVDDGVATSNQGPWPAPPDVRWVASQTGVVSASVIIVVSPPDVAPLPITLEALAPIADDHANTFADAGALGVDAPITGAIDYPGDQDVFRLSVREGVIYDLNASPQDDALLPSIELLNLDGGALASDDVWVTGLAATLPWRAAATGEVLVRLRGISATRGRYRLVATQPAEDLGPDEVSQAEPLVAMDVVEDLVTPGDEDWFTVQLAPGQRLSVTLTSPDGVTLQVEKPEGSGSSGSSLRSANGDTSYEGYVLSRVGGTARLRVGFDDSRGRRDVRRYRLSIDSIE